MVYYLFQRDYNHVNLLFFDNMVEIVQRINNSGDEKWLVFVDNKEKAQDLKEELQVSVTYLDAESKDKGVQEWGDLIRTEAFKSQVLLTTSVLDCGVNIKDPKLRNIVVVSDNRVATMQMAGRKRCENGKTVNVWVQEPSKLNLSVRAVRTANYLDLEQQFDSICMEERKRKFVNLIWNHEDDGVRSLFTLTLHNVYKSECGFVYQHRMHRFYRQLLDGEILFREAVESWFEKESAPTESELDQFFQEHRDENLEEEAQDELRKIICRAYKRAGYTEAQPKRTGVLKHTALNNRLQELNLPYEIEADGTVWKLLFIGTQEEQEGEEGKTA